MSIRDEMIEYGETYEAAVERLADGGDQLRKAQKENAMATKETEVAPQVTIFTPADVLVDLEDPEDLWSTDPFPNNVVMRWCPHCLAVTAQVGPIPDKWPEETPEEPKIIKTAGHCLQCIADGGDCCDLAAFSRWPSEDEELSIADQVH